MDAGLLNVLHDPAQEQLGAVVEGVDVDLDGVVQEAVNEQRAGAVGAPGLGGGAVQVVRQARHVVDDLHAAPAQHVAGAYQDREADGAGHRQGLLVAAGGAVGGGGQAGALQDHAEELAVLRGVDGLRAGAQDGYARGLEACGQGQGGLPAELDHHAGHGSRGQLGLVDLHDVLEGQRLEVEPVGDVVVGGDGLGVAVDHDGLVAVRQGHGGVDAGVVELDALADAVGAGPQDNDGLPLARGDLGLGVVAGVVVGGAGGELRRAGVHGLVDRAQAEGVADLTDCVLPYAPQVGDLGVGEAVALGPGQHLGGQGGGGGDLLGDLLEQEHLVQEPGVDAGGPGQLGHTGPPAQGPLDLQEAVLGGRGRAPDQVGGLLGCGGGAGPGEDGALLVDGAHGLLEGLGEGAADGHGLAHGLHGGGQGGVGPAELLEGEAGDLDHHVVQGGLEGGRGGAGDVVGDLVQGVAHGQAGGDLGDGEAGGLGGQGRGARDPGVHLDDHDAAAGRVHGELDVAAAGVHPDLAYDGDADVAQALELPVGQGQGGGHGDGVPGVHAHGVHVLYGAHHHHVVGGVAHELQLVLLPAQDGLLQEHLGGARVGQALAGDALQVGLVVGDAAAQAPHGEGGAHHHRVAAQLPHPLAALLHGAGDDGPGHLGPAALDDGLELLPVLPGVNGRRRGSNELHAVALQDPGLGQGHGRVEGGLPAQGGQQGVGALLGDNGGDGLGGDGLHVGGVGHVGVGHNGGRVGVDQDHPDALGPQDAAGLGVCQFRHAGRKKIGSEGGARTHSLPVNSRLLHH